MKKLSLLLSFLLYPTVLLAQNQSGGSLSFAPPPGDYSVVFLGNIFGVVDGVLHGSGSQIMGTMFGVFNAAVLALGGIIIMYTLIVSTMNTAQEGQLLGQKWSSIWVPVRSTLGLALLIPKASGYCMMQVFIMWVVVQGIGAADKIWDAALGYLNRGGVIIQAQMDPVTSINADSNSVAVGASTILMGQVCMAGLQKILYQQRQSLLNQKTNKSGPCYGLSSTSNEPMAIICNNQVPDFLATVNAVREQTDHKTAKSFTIQMPNLSKTKYSALTGICGEISWNAYDPNELKKAKDVGVDKDNLETIELSRAIAIQQMYSSLTSVAQRMVTNNPKFSRQSSNNNDASQKNVSNVAIQQYGVPYNVYGTYCSKSDTIDGKCATWGADTSFNSAPLFNGTAFQGAIQDYNAVMLPTLNLAKQALNKETAKNQRKFISEAERHGWILAGSYFWDIAQLNSAAMSGGGGSNLTDKNTGLGNSQFNLTDISGAFGKTCEGKYQNLCIWLQSDSSLIKNLVGLFDGSSFRQTSLPKPDAAQSSGDSIQSMVKEVTEKGSITGKDGSTVYGFISNSLKMRLPNQPGLTPIKFNLKMDIYAKQAEGLKKENFGCGFQALGICIGGPLGDLFYNNLLVPVLNWFLEAAINIINATVFAFIVLPFQGVAEIFRVGVDIIQKPSVNPIIALANMGTHYINFAMDLWIYLLLTAIGASLIPLFGGFIWALIAMALPLLMGWMTIMLSLGMLTAYYIPFLPYMIFTFGTIAWFMAVIEAMVAAPIVALGITHPEGNEALGKGEQALMIILNVFLRPSMMIIGYISAIALSYVAVWLLNAGFQNVADFIQGQVDVGGVSEIGQQIPDRSGVKYGYTAWSGIFGFFFVILMYTSLYVILVQRSFGLITMLPDKVLRFIGGQAESLGAETAQWGEEAKTKVQEGGKETMQAGQQISSKMSGYGQKAAGAVGGAVKGIGSGSGDGGVKGVGGPDSKDSG